MVCIEFWVVSLDCGVVFGAFVVCGWVCVCLFVWVW